MSKYLPDFAGIFCLAIFLISLSTVSGNLLRDGDTFWHIKVGTVMLEQQKLVDSDIFSHTAYGSPWTAHEWLSEIIMAMINRIAGLEGILCFFLLIASLSFWLLYKITEKYTHQLLTFGCVSLALVFSPIHMAARPHMFTWLFMVITLAILTTGGKHLYWLPAITLVWANLHGGFILGLVLQIIFIVGSGMDSYLVCRTPFVEILRKQKVPTLILLLSFFAIGLNPFGYELLAFPFQVSKGVFSKMIGEWKAPNLQDMWYFRYYLVALFLLVSLRKSTVTWTERLLIVFFLNAALTHIRHVGLMLMALTPFTARMIDRHLSNWCRTKFEDKEKKQIQLSSKSGPMVTAVIMLVLLLAGSINHRALMFLTPEKLVEVETGQLNQLVGYLEDNQPNGNMFNEYALGGYLLYALTTPPKVFIDGRADMYGEQIMSDYNKILSSSSEREKLLDKYDIGWIVFEKDSDLVRDLKNLGHWQTTFANEYYVVVTRADTGKAAQVDVD